MTYRLFESEQHASTYVRTRPCPPASLIDVILNRLEQNLPRNANNRWPFAVDVGAGSGQNTFMIKDHFDSILGVDISEAQINEAEKLNQFSNIIFKVAPAESIPLPSQSVQLVTASECIHWFDFVKFYRELDRILIPGGMLAAFGYHPIPSKCHISESSPLLSRKFEEIVEKACTTLYDAGYWDKNAIDLLFSRYENLVLPYSNSYREDNIYHTSKYTAKDIVEYIKSLSAFNQFRNVKPDSAKCFLIELQKKMQDILMDDHLDAVKIDVTFEFFVIISKKDDNLVQNNDHNHMFS